jgi:F-type H+-transporting ATPase subunit delta
VELSTLAKPYAQAIMLTAGSAKEQRDWLKFSGLLASVSASEDIKNILARPGTSKEEKINTLNNIITKLHGKKLSKKESNFLELIIKNERFSVMPSVYSQFDSLVGQNSKNKQFKVTTAYKLTAAEEKELSKSLTDKHKVSVEIDSEVDDSLLGGVVIKDGDKVLDSSIQARLEALHQKLSSN